MVKEAKKQTKGGNPYLPVMGFILGIAYIVMAYFLGPLLVDVAEYAYEEIQGEAFETRVPDADRPTLEYVFMGFTFLVLFSFSMMIVAAALNEDPDVEDRLVKPRPEDGPKAMKKYIKEYQKMEARRLKRAEKLKREEAKRNQ